MDLSGRGKQVQDEKVGKVEQAKKSENVENVSKQLQLMPGNGVIIVVKMLEAINSNLQSLVHIMDDMNSKMEKK